MKVNATDLVKGKRYYLTYDFYPFGGSCVVFKKRVPAKEIWPGSRLKGMATFVELEDGSEEFVLHPSAWIFDEPT